MPGSYEQGGKVSAPDHTLEDWGRTSRCLAQALTTVKHKTVWVSRLVRNVPLLRVDVWLWWLFVFVGMGTEAKPCSLGRSGSALRNERSGVPSLGNPRLHVLVSQPSRVTAERCGTTNSEGSSDVQRCSACSVQLRVSGGFAHASPSPYVAVEIVCAPL